MPAPFPEALVGNDPVSWFHHHCGGTSAPEGLFHPEALADYLRALEDAEVITGICEDYRAAVTIDLEHDRASRDAGQKVECPLLVLWGARGIIGKLYDPLPLWQSYAHRPVTGGAVASGHYLAEEAPAEVLAFLDDFLRSEGP